MNATQPPMNSGSDLMALIRRLYPICRSITGDGNRQTLSILREYLDLTIHEVPTGAAVYDWTVPPEWNIREAWIKGPDGRKMVDFRDSNLHVVGYSQPVQTTLTRDELLPRLHSLPEHPDWIPYRTSYYQPTWGFCLADRVKQQLPEGPFEVNIDADLKPGSLTYGDWVKPGRSSDEVLITTHLCHPSMANDNLSGIAVAVHLAQRLVSMSTRFTYRFLFIPGTIGSITWLARNEEVHARIRHGLALSCLGDAGPIHYKKTRDGKAGIDRAVALALRDGAPGHVIQEFSPYGYDERQFNSPGIRLPVGLFTRSPHGTYPEYHTSADNLDFIRPDSLIDSLEKLIAVMTILEGDGTYLNTQPRCEPQLGRRGLYDQLGGANDRHQQQMAMLWVLNLSDGEHSLVDVAERSGLPFGLIRDNADRLVSAGLLIENNGPRS
ncbi:MAG TPA: DUF4910 domain-containing protein [Kiritimatiellia bacterium]|mgnify:CR=1 FL=1|nr:DUF4910 domain-containing protein [Kiritimatiellia bacterium]HMO99336.1 DUF4910 domain-containing protein [Kiritimatiellia bacterium]HMP96094.1 DUF4910 domain-containing protein [Kiritimatiellia bacterium]